MVSKNEFAKNQMASASRTSSDSSLVANVDENFEMDQVLTLGDNGKHYVTYSDYKRISTNFRWFRWLIF